MRWPVRRRTFIALLSGTAVVGSLDAWAQQSQPPLIAVLEGASAATMADRYDAFRAGLRELGYVEGVNIRIEYRYADGCVPRTHRRKKVRNCVRDGGRSSGAGRQGQASNHRKLRRSKAGVVSVAEKAGLDPVRYGSERRARANR